MFSESKSNDRLFYMFTFVVVFPDLHQVLWLCPTHFFSTPMVISSI